MSDQIAQMKKRLAEQEAWGKWNTAPLANEIARLEWAAMSRPQRAVATCVRGVGFGALFLVSSLPVALPLVRLVQSLFGG